jgi:SHS2 domain-containing protein
MDGAYRVLSHTADTGIEASAASFEAVVATTAVGMFDLMYDLASLTPSSEIVAAVSAIGELDEIIVDALSELLYLAEADDLLCTDVIATRSGNNELRIVAAATPTAGVELRGPPVKAVTYHDLSVAEVEPGRWIARVYFDT